MNGIIEVSVWIEAGKESEFRNLFASHNDVKYDGSEIISVVGEFKLHAIFYRMFGKTTYQSLKFPDQMYYSLKAVYE